MPEELQNPCPQLGCEPETFRAVDEVLGASGSGPALAADRCPHPRPFDPGFRSCPNFHLVHVLSADSNNFGLNPYLACSHLAQGRNEHGGYYASCALGGPRERAELAAQNQDRLQSLGIPPDRVARALAEWTKARQMPLARLGRMVQQTGSDPLRGLWIRLASALEAGEASAGDGAWKATNCNAAAPSPGAAGLEIEAAANRVRLRGQIDRDAWEQLAGLAVMATALDGDLILDMGGVSFCDVGGLRILLALAQARRERSALVLESVPPELARALPTLGWNAGSMASSR